MPVLPIDGMPHNIGSALTHDPTDAELVADVRDGRAAAFDVLVRRHYRAAFAIALANTGNRADAEDVCHDTFVRAAERLDDCRYPDRFAHWLLTIARNLGRNALAKSRVRRAAPLEHGTAASGESPERDAELSDLREQLTRALGELSPIQREVVLLHDLDGWPHDAIADVIGTSAGMSRQHLFKARKRLRASLGERSSEEYFHE